MFISILKYTNQYPIQTYIYPFEYGHGLQIPVSFSRNSVCVDVFTFSRRSRVDF
jgi:hypothetical protein